AKQVPGEHLAPAPAQQCAGDRFDDPHKRAQQPMNQPKRTRQHHAQARRIGLKEHLREKIEESVEQEDKHCEYEHEPNAMLAECMLQNLNEPTENDEVSDGVADQ